MLNLLSSCILLLVSSNVAHANIQFSRSVDQLEQGNSATVTLDQGCSSTDDYGSNDCALSWGTNYTATIKAHISEVLMGNSSFSVDMKVDGIIPFKFTCPVCGTTCTVTIPIVKQTTSFQLPDCPVTGDFNLVEPIALPSKSPIGVSSGAKGTVQVTNGAGTVVAHVTVDATLKPSFNSEEL
mmetsp:Transcript_45841/g.73734  ORF Transcript_45841/g.73734 Transcript_45841/m.73734 type:complete len:182 (-) Transcript_45841:214-759(-)